MNAYTELVNTPADGVNAVGDFGTKPELTLSSDLLGFVADHNVTPQDIVRAFGDQVDGLSIDQSISSMLRACAYKSRSRTDEEALKATLEDVVSARPCFLDDYCFVETEGKFYQIKDRSASPLDAFSLAHADLLVPLQVTHFVGDRTPRTAKDAFFMRPNAKKVKALSWQPAPIDAEQSWMCYNSSGAKCLNTWPGFKLEPKEGTVQPWLDHVLRIVGGDEALARYLTQRFAFDVQFPHLKSNVAVVFTGVEGGGKDAILTPMSYIFGKSFKVVGNKAVKSGYDDEWYETKIIQLNEVQGVSGDAIEMLKSRTASTAGRTEILNIKSHGKQEQGNYWSVYCTTNHIDALKLTPNDRRWLVIKLTDPMTKEQSAEYFDDWARKDGPSYLLTYLLKVDLSDFDPMAAPPRTAAFNEMMEATRNELATRVEDIIAKDPGILPQYVKATDVQEALNAGSKPEHQLPITKVKRLLEELGYSLLTDPRKTVNGIKVRYGGRAWYAKNGDPLLHVKSEAEVYHVIAAAHQAAKIDKAVEKDLTDKLV